MKICSANCMPEDGRRSALRALSLPSLSASFIPTRKARSQGVFLRPASPRLAIREVRARALPLHGGSEPVPLQRVCHDQVQRAPRHGGKGSSQSRLIGERVNTSVRIPCSSLQRQSILASPLLPHIIEFPSKARYRSDLMNSAMAGWASMRSRKALMRGTCAADSQASEN